MNIFLMLPKYTSIFSDLSCRQTRQVLQTDKVGFRLAILKILAG
jgi:hypothetical protein